MKSICRSLFFLLLATCVALPALAQFKPVPGEAPSAEQGLNATELQTLRDSLKMTPQLRADRNALADHSIHSLVIDQDKLHQTDAYFTHVIKDPGSITNQAASGRCWMFAGLNMLRPEVINKYNMKDFRVSQAYEQFYQKLEAANRSLEFAIALRNQPIHSRRMDTLLKDIISDGGNWNYVQALIDKYGVVPESVMPNDYAAQHTNEMVHLLAARLRKAVVQIREASAKGESIEQMRAIKTDALKDVYKILVLCLGEPPQTFQWRYEMKNGTVSPLKTYTPKSFYQEFFGNELHNYVRFVNYPGQPMHTKLEWAWERNMADHENLWAINITDKEMEEMALKSVMADQPVWFGANSQADGDRTTGLWLNGLVDSNDLFGIDFNMNKKDTLDYDNGTPDHAMVFTGVDVQNGVPDKWKVENSWGTKVGQNGWFTIGQKWFNQNVFEVIIDKRFVPPELLKLVNEKPVVLPPWDPFTDWN